MCRAIGNIRMEGRVIYALKVSPLPVLVGAVPGLAGSVCCGSGRPGSLSYLEISSALSGVGLVAEFKDIFKPGSTVGVGVGGEVKNGV